MTKHRRKIPFYILLTVFIAIYLFNIDGWLMHDDEGTDFYEVWQLQEGQEPGADYIAEQQPLFLISGSFLVGLCGQLTLPLRLLSMLQVLAGPTSAMLMAVAILMFMMGLISEQVAQLRFERAYSSLAHFD